MATGSAFPVSASLAIFMIVDVVDMVSDKKPMVRVKICGMTHAEDVALCAEAGAAALGFVVEYPLPTPWTLTRAQAAQLMAAAPPFVSRVIVVGGVAEPILDLCTILRPNAVQLHSDESEEVVRAVAHGLAGSGIQIIKAVRIRALPLGTEGEPTHSPQHWAEIARRFLAAGAHAILLDSKADHRPGGTGQTFDWQIARQVAQSVGPIILAGGLTPDNVGSAIATVQPYAVDVISALEDQQHRKVPARVQAFIAAAQGMQSS